jgi:hypothetical protein
MKTTNLLVSACRYCRYYKSQGRRGGTCQLLDVSVHGGWKACALAIPAFAPSWENLEDMMNLPDAIPALAEVTPQVCALTQPPVESNKVVGAMTNM